VERLIDDVPIHYEVRGAGRPVIILHGTPLDHHSVEACLEPIFSTRKGWRRIYPDLPGFGKTPGPDWIENNDQMLHIILKFIETLTLGERFAVVGESYGGYLARGIVHETSSQVEGLLLWTPAKYLKSERRLPPRVVRIKDDQIAKGLTTDAERSIFGLFVVQSKDAVEFARKHVIPGWEMANEKFAERVVNTKFSFDLNSIRFSEPTFIICGRQDSVVGYEDSFEILTNYPKATFVVVDGAGHTLGFTEGLPLFRAAVNTWLDSLEIKER